MTNPPEPIIELSGIAKHFGGVQALRGVDFRLLPGEVHALVGENGAGKSTLIKLLLNMWEPSTGEATVLGMPLTALHGTAFQRIGYVSEKQEMPEWMTVGSLMEHLRPMYPIWDDKDLLEELDLPLDRRIKHLSRGMRMKTALASVLAFKPELLVMDEPFTGLDTAIRTDLVRALLGRTQVDDPDNTTTIVISSHDLDEMENFATHVAFLHDGELLFAEPIDTLLARCREVTVRFEQVTAEQSISKLAEGCIAAEASGALLRFVDMRVNVDDHEGAIRSLMPDVVHVQSEPIGLRSIFLALNREKRTNDRSRV